MGENMVPGAWSVDMEVNLFHAMRGVKPVGVNRHFTMVSIHAKLNPPSTKYLTSKDLWDHLSTMYDLQALNESEFLPFPNDLTHFKLPEFDYKIVVENSEFPRMQNVGMAPTWAEDTKVKPEGQAKGGKSSRSDSKASHQHSKTSTPTDSKVSSSRGDNKGSTLDNKSTSQNSKSSGGGSAGSGRSEGKGGSSSKAGGSHSSAASTPDHTPKRTKRTRVGPSANSSPASSDAPPAKRRR